MTLSRTHEQAGEETHAQPRPRVTTNRVVVWLLVALSAQFLLLGVVEAWKDSPTFDEGYYVSGGVTALTRHQLRLTPEHGVLAKALGALPALAAHPVVPGGTSWREGNQNGYYYDFLFAQQHAHKLWSVFFLARLGSLAEGLALGWALYALATALFGRPAGVIAAAAWFTTPFSLAFSHIVGSDLPFALAVVLSGLALQRWAARQTVGRLVVLGLSCVALLLTRFTGLALVPVFAFGVVVLADDARLRRRLTMGAAVLAMAWVGVWVILRALSPFPHYRHAAGFIGAVREAGFTRWARVIPWPKEYAAGIQETGRLANTSTDTLLFGRHGVGARWLYWPGAMVVKLPASAMLLVAAALLCWFVAARSARARMACAVVLPLIVLIVVTVPYGRPSLRYLLAAIVLLFVLGAGALARALPWKVGRVAVGVLALVQLVMLWSAIPHSLAWTAPPFQPGYHFIGDTSDWGQDYYRLKHWATGKNAMVEYFGPPLSVPGARPFFGADPRDVRGWVAVSASWLTYQAFTQSSAPSWLRAYCPVGTIGGSILLYRFRAPPDTRKGPVAPARACPGPYSHRVDSHRVATGHDAPK